MAIEHQHKSARALVLSANMQNTYGVTLADAALTARPPVVDGSNFADITRSYYTNSDLANKGHDYVSVRQVQQQDVSMQLSGQVSDWLAGWLISQVLNSVTTTGAASPYSHLFKPLNTTRLAKSTTIYMEDTAAIKSKYIDLVAADLTISGSSNGPLQFQINFNGSGRIVDGAMAGGAPAAQSPTILMAQDTDVLLGPSGAPVSVKQYLRSWQVKISRQLEVFRGPGGGLYAVQVNADTLRATWSFTMRAKDTELATDPRSLFLNDTLQELQINCNSGAAAQLKFKFPNTYVKVEETLDGNYVAWQVEGAEDDVMKLGNSEIIEVTVLNGQATWLVGA